MLKLSLQEIQQYELNILVEFDTFCKENGLTYSLVGGTLLGAVRHKGFIPWDDDIDVGMPRPDYERFVKMMEERGYRLSESITVTTDRGDNATMPFIKLLDKRTSVPTELCTNSESLWIDVFPFDGCPADMKKAKKLFKKAAHYRHIIVYNYFDRAQMHGAKKPLYMAYMLYAKAYGRSKAVNKLNRLATSNPYEGAERVAGVVWGLYKLGEIISGDSFEKTVELDFEGHKFPAIYNYDEYLTGLYGDYMTPPPENKRKSHHLVAYATDEANETKEGERQ